MIVLFSALKEIMADIERRKTNRYKAILKNRILATLTLADQNLIFPFIKRVKLIRGTTLLNPSEGFSEFIFPTSALISLKFDSADGKVIEVGAIGNEGIVDASFIMGNNITSLRMYVSYTGYGYRIKSNDFYKLLETLPSLKSQTLLYTRFLFSQTCLNVACNRLHSIEQQYAKILLSTADCLSTNNLLFSHESMSNRMGVRRESITTSSKKLKDAGVVDYNRGKLMILNRTELKNLACECYLIGNKELGFLYGNLREDCAG